MKTRQQRRRAVLAAVASLALVGVVIPATAQADDGTEILTNPTFDGGMAPWWVAGGVEFAETEAGMCGVVPGGGQQWDVIVGQGDVSVAAGETYTIGVTASAVPAASARVLVPDPEAEWPPLYYADIALGADGQAFTEAFELAADAETEVQVQLGGNAGDFELWPRRGLAADRR